MKEDFQWKTIFDKSQHLEGSHTFMKDNRWFWPFMEEELQKETFYDGTQASMKDNLRCKTIFHRRRPLIENHLGSSQRSFMTPLCHIPGLHSFFERHLLCWSIKANTSPKLIIHVVVFQLLHHLGCLHAILVPFNCRNVQSGKKIIFLRYPDCHLKNFRIMYLVNFVTIPA